MTGLSPSAHGAVESPETDDWSARLRAGTFVARPGGRLDESRVTLAEVLKGRGYGTFAAVSGGFCRAEFGFGQGFDRFLAKGLRLADLLPEAQAFIAARRDRPFFLYVHVPDAHDYGGADMKNLPAEPGKLKALYDRGVADADERLGRLLSGVDFSRTVVIVTADHGESFGEHGARRHKTSPSNEQLRVPLLVRGPGAPKGARPAVLARSIDILPTALDLLGVPAPAPIEGRSLAPALRGERLAERPAVSEPYVEGGYALTLQSARWKLVRLPDGGTRLFDLSADPAEERPLSDPAKERAMSAALDAWRASLPALEKPSGSRRLDEKTARELRRAGYLR
jgi:arylsulfatase A-like enzyme